MQHCLVWIDHRLADLYAVTRHDFSKVAAIHAPEPRHGHVHHKAGTMGPGHDPVPAGYLEEVVAALKDADEILIAGPADAKHALKRHLAEKHPALDSRVIGVEALDKTDPGTLQEFARRIFHRIDRMRPASA